MPTTRSGRIKKVNSSEIKNGLTDFRARACVFVPPSLQLLVGGLFLRHTPNAFLAALGLVAVPNVIGNVIGPIAVTVSGLIWNKAKAGNKKSPAGQPSANVSAS